MGIRLTYITTVPSTLVELLRDQIGYMRLRGLDVHAITSPGRDLDTFRTYQDIPVHPIPMRREISPFSDLLALARMVRTLRKIRPDIVHASTPKAGLLGILAAWALRIPVRIYLIRGFRFVTTRGIKRWVLRTVERLSCRLATDVYCVSPSNLDYAIAEGIVEAEKIAVLGSGSSNGVDAEMRFNPDHVPSETRTHLRQELAIPLDALVVGFIGRLVRDKGIVDLLEAFRLIQSECPEVHLLLVGPLEKEDPLPTECITALRRDPRIHLAGQNSDIPAFLSTMDVLAFPSHREGLPNILLQASAMALPVVATQIPGCVDVVVNGETGTLVPCGDIGALAKATSTYVGNDVLAAAGDEHELLDAGFSGLFDGVLDDRLIDDRKHLLRHGLGGRQKARAKTGDGQDRFADGSGVGHRNLCVSCALGVPFIAHRCSFRPLALRAIS